MEIAARLERERPGTRLANWSGDTLSEVHRGEHGSGPRLVLEPQSVVRFSSETGAVLPCSAEGRPVPAIAWEMADGGPANDISGLRETRPDGSLVLRSFGPSLFRPEIHSATYRCVASNALGLVKSRLVHVRGVVAEDFVPIVQDVYAIRRNAAVLRCHLPAAVRDYITVVSWMRSDGAVVGSRGTAGQKGAEGRYAMLPTGELVTRGLGATASEAFYTYRCQVRNAFTGQTRLSDTAGKIVVTEPVSDLAPRMTETRRLVHVVQGQEAALPCVAQGHPPPAYSWFRVTDRMHKRPTSGSGLGGDVIPLRSSDRMLLRFGGSVLVIRAASVKDGGKYICVANSSAGQEKVYTEVHISVFPPASLSAHVEPAAQVVDAGRSINVTCRVSGQPVHGVLWTRNGRPLFSASPGRDGISGDALSPTSSARVRLLSRDVLRIVSAKRQDSGMFQCLAFNADDSAQGSAEIIVREDAPVLNHVFSELLAVPGSTVSLRCAASGNPLPQVTWALDGDSVPESYNVRVGDYVSSERLVHSYVNLTGVRVEDGGLYACEARNSAGQASHSARLIVPGRPVLRRPMGNVTALAGRSMVLHCPVAGHPIRSVTWKKDGRWLPQNHRQRSFPNGTLVVNQVQRGQDSGTYGCMATDPDGNMAGGELTVRVMTPPVVSPFNFPNDLTEGKRAGAACIVSDGDPPISIGWLKDGRPLDETALGATVSRTNDYTSFLSIAAVRQEAHSGLYTCVASNPAASANRSATMVVRVGPRWRHRPEDKAATMGQPVTFDCQADGFPVPVIRWKKERLSEDGGRQFATITSSARVRVLENGTLAIDDVDRSDAGRYLCQSLNGVGPGVSTVVKLDVHVAAHFVEKFKAVTVRRGDSASLECRAHGDPSIDLSWTRDGRRFDPAQEPRYAVEKNTGSSWSESVLRITGADRRDSSLFGCRAENAYGADDASFRLIIQEPPDKVAGLEPTHISSRTVTLAWSVPYSGNSPLLKYLLEHRTLSGTWEREVDVSTAHPTDGGLSHLVQGLQPSTNYEFRVRAGNALGLGDFSDPTIVTTKQEAPSGSPQDIKVTPAGSRSLYVTWKPPSEEDKYGGVQGYYVGYRVWGSGQPYLYKTLESRLPSSSPSQLQQCILSELRPRTRYGIVVQAFNADGAGPSSDEIVAHTPDVDLPAPPLLKLVSTTSSTIQLSWLASKHQPIDGYVLFYKGEPRLGRPTSVVAEGTPEWSSVQTTAERSTYVFRGLSCGSSYVFYALAFNSAGRGPRSNVVLAKTDGSVPVAPDLRELLVANPTRGVLRLTAWKSGGCPITSFTVLHRRHSAHDHWDPPVTVHAPDASELSKLPQELAIRHLTPATRYQLLVTAHSEAGSTHAEYVFATPTLSEGALSATHWTEATDLQRRSVDVVVPVVCTVLVTLLGAAVVGYAMSRRRLAALRRRRLGSFLTLLQP
ncbi:Down syndrome cell adhesion molecule-like protein Dscam2 [Rhipicephalus sanguineus]|uniref:Down syndrome cell adhesion molecule-like protein Dscam2 n=1 Tax=Rhipicephalus sanguineus TaxID=34632 RepID=UPI0020C3F1D8|nr:Down syndrome cell adhesion molecule-like protein Dscam2 [Rhipicephalus sanguineus]